MTNGYQKRLVLFDLSGNVLPGYNPLRENGLRIDFRRSGSAKAFEVRVGRVFLILLHFWLGCCISASMWPGQ